MRTALLSNFRIGEEDFAQWCQTLKTVLFERWPGVAVLLAGGGASDFVRVIFDECGRRRDLSAETTEEEIGRWVRIEYPMADLETLRNDPLPEEVLEDLETSLL